MKSRMMWMALAVAALVSTSAWAVWNPDTDPNLLFNMNFEVYNNSTHKTTDAKAGLVGTLDSYNDVNYNVFGETSAAGLGHDANFAAMHDFSPGAAIGLEGPCPNDVRLAVPATTSLFDLGLPAVKHTWTFWFNAPSITDGTIIRHANAYAYYYLFDPDNYTIYKDKVWEIRIYAGKLQFYHKKNCLKMETASTLSELGLTINTWHHAAVVIDRSTAVQTSVPTTQQSCKIYVDGLEAPIIVNSVNTETMNLTSTYDFPLWIGAGERVFNGLLDEVRLFSGDLNSIQVSLLYQCDKTQPVALLPIPRSSEVVIGTGLSWVPAPGQTAQKVYFGTNTDANLLPLITGAGSDNRTNAELGGLLTLNTKYYWYIRSTISGSDVKGPLWSFTTETGRAINPSPADGAEDVNENFVDVNWATPTAATYTVYLSVDSSLVASGDTSVRIANGITDHNIIATTGSRGSIFYWRVDSNYGGTIGTVTGDIWSFRTKPYELVFNTDNDATTYADHVIPGLTCVLHGAGWSDPCATATLDSNIAVFNFPNGFNYDRRYDIIVVPDIRPQDIDFNQPTPLAIHVTGNFYFDGRVQIAGDDITTTTQDITFARSGGFPGPKKNCGESVWTTTPRPLPADYWTPYLYNGGTEVWHTRLGNTGNISNSPSGTTHYIYEPTAICKASFGPGIPVNPPYKGGGGGGAGGMGGDSGRGFYHGVDSRGPSYGDKEVPVPFGGSGGGWGGGSSPGGAAGGGGIEIVATGNVTLDVNSRILAHGGGQNCGASTYPAGGAGGGSVRIIAGGSVTNKGIIDVNGGKGGNGSTDIWNTGGGGGGGRVAIFHGGAFTDTGTIAANGGAKGMAVSDPNNPGVLVTFAENGQDGTIYVVDSAVVSPMKASAPTPKNGDKTVYTGHPDPCTIKLKWYSGYGGTTDRVYCDTFSPPTTQRGGNVAVTRGQHSVTMTVSSGNTYYWKVVTDGTVSSDTWSFSTRNWRCPIANPPPGGSPHPAGLEWDTNHDCVIDFEDFEYFADDWLNPEFGTFTLEFYDFNRFANEWRQCFNRTDGGCAGF